MKRSSRRTWPPSAGSIAPEWPSSGTARRRSVAEARGPWSCRSRYGASMYFTNCWAVSVTWPSASSTVIAVSSSGESLRSSWLLADHVEQCLALLVAHDLERAGQRVGQRRRVLDALGVAAGGAAHQLVVGRRLEVRERHGGRLDAGTRGRGALDRALARA